MERAKEGAQGPSQAPAEARDPDNRPPAMGGRALRGAPRYLRELHTALRRARLAGLDVCLDCANAPPIASAPEIFRRLGAQGLSVIRRPAGRCATINAGCGSTHMRCWPEAVVAGAHDVGLAFDGAATVCGGRAPRRRRRRRRAGLAPWWADPAPALRRAAPARQGRSVTVMGPTTAFTRRWSGRRTRSPPRSVGDRVRARGVRARGWIFGGGS